MTARKKAGWFCLIGLLMTLAICAGAPAGAADPIIPHIFYGNATIGSLPAPAGTHITAVATGGGKEYWTTVPGVYGSTELTIPKFEVQGNGETNIANGAPITFFINGIQAQVYEVGKGPWQASFPFKEGDLTNLDLAISGTQYTISATAGVGGTISPSGNVPVIEGADKTFTITPDSCHTILDVKVDSVSIGAVSSHTFTTVTDDHTINATFATKTVYVTASAGQGGTISPVGQQPVQCGGKITFTITPSTGYIIQDVVVNAVSKGPVSSYTIDPVTMNQTIVASFTTTPAINFTITATAGQHGNITPAGAVSVMYGEDQAFTMVPDSGYTIDELLVDGNPVIRMPTYTFSNVVANHTIAVTFMEGAPEYFATQLGDGWNLFSTPIKLASGHKYLENIFPPDSLENIEVILGWDGSVWFIPGYGYELKPLFVVYVKVQDSATAVLYPSQEVSMPPSRSMAQGWNLIGPAPDYKNGGFAPKSVEASLITIDPGYLIVVSPGLNQEGWSYTYGGDPEYLVPYKGYWVFMENPGILAGFSTTPIS